MNKNKAKFKLLLTLSSSSALVPLAFLTSCSNLTTQKDDTSNINKNKNHQSIAVIEENTKNNNNSLETNASKVENNQMQNEDKKDAENTVNEDLSTSSDESTKTATKDESEAQDVKNSDSEINNNSSKQVKEDNDITNSQELPTQKPIPEETTKENELNESKKDELNQNVFSEDQEKDQSSNNNNFNESQESESNKSPQTNDPSIEEKEELVSELLNQQKDQENDINHENDQPQELNQPQSEPQIFEESQETETQKIENEVIQPTQKDEDIQEEYKENNSNQQQTQNYDNASEDNTKQDLNDHTIVDESQNSKNSDLNEPVNTVEQTKKTSEDKDNSEVNQINSKQDEENNNINESIEEEVIKTDASKEEEKDNDAEDKNQSTAKNEQSNEENTLKEEPESQENDEDDNKNDQTHLNEEKEVILNQDSQTIINKENKDEESQHSQQEDTSSEDQKNDQININDNKSEELKHNNQESDDNDKQNASDSVITSNQTTETESDHTLSEQPSTQKEEQTPELPQKQIQPQDEVVLEQPQESEEKVDLDTETQTKESQSPRTTENENISQNQENQIYSSHQDQNQMNNHVVVENIETQQQSQLNNEKDSQQEILSEDNSTLAQILAINGDIISNPYNQEISADQQYSQSNFNYGTAPLVRKKTELLKEQDIEDMFTYIVANRISENYTFGDRNLPSSLVANAYAKWMIKEWKKYPYFSLSSGAIAFIQGKNGDHNTVVQITAPRYSTKWYQQSQHKDSFDNFVNLALTKIKPGMTQYEKAFALWSFVVEYFKYDIARLTSSWENDIEAQRTVCAVYATSYAYLLNLVGIEAITNTTGKDSNDDLHQVVYLKLTLPDQNTPKWYVSDATWGDVAGTKTQINDRATWYSKETNFKEFLMPLGKDAKTPLGHAETIQFHSGLFWELPYEQFFSQNDIHLGESTKINFDEYAIYSYLFTQNNETRSRAEYYNGKWYSLMYKNTRNARNNKYHLVARDFYRKGLHLQQNDLVDLSDYIKDQSLLWGITNPILKRPMLASYQETFIFSSLDRSGQVTFVFLNMRTKEYKTLKPQTQSDLSSNQLTNYFIKNGSLFYELNFTKELEVKLPEDIYKFIYENNPINQNDIERLTYKYNALVGSYLIGNNTGEITLTKKQEFLSFLDNKLNQSKTTTDESQLKQIYDSINSEYQALIKQIYTSNLKIYPLSHLPSNVELTKSYFDTYGYKFDGFGGSLNIQDAWNVNDNLRYTILFSRDNNDYQVVSENLQKEQLKLSLLNFKGNGYYKVQISYHLNYNDSINYTSTPVKIEISEKENYLNVSTLYNKSLQISNYSATQQKLQTNEEVQNINASISNPNLYSYSANLIFIDYKTKQKQILKTITSSAANSKIEIDVNDSKYKPGIYYIEVSYTANSQNNKVYSNYYFNWSNDFISKNKEANNQLLIDMINLTKDN
ncbi:hypothetical protein V2E24_03460 [Mycoplasmopsis ciconiae]|uniref:Transglutaminase-like domain-containing protein n=1 Tax=Mycoplasmopsis ciconiae TaxID=561067 RepID=A0ABU7MM92_9BACT|nr:hypothetical protein [Mycoplasmopsis ciconiae]